MPFASLLLCLVPAASTAPPLVRSGPPALLRKVVGLAPVPPVPIWVHGGVRALMRDIPGAVVVVEEEGLAPWASEPVRVNLLRGRLRLMAPEVKRDLGLEVPPAPWMDPTVLHSGGNVAHRYFSFGSLR